MTFVHFIQLFTVYMIVLKYVPAISIFENGYKKVYVCLGFFAFLLLHYALLYNKERWEVYIKEFEGESRYQRFRGWLYVLSYLIGSIVVFFLSLFIIYG